MTKNLHEVMTEIADKILETYCLVLDFENMRFNIEPISETIRTMREAGWSKDIYRDLRRHHHVFCRRKLDDGSMSEGILVSRFDYLPSTIVAAMVSKGDYFEIIVKEGEKE